MKTKLSATDRLVKEVTAFRSWNEMRECMERGYVPTINGGKAHAKLTGICRRNGYKVYRLGRVA